MNKKYLKYIIIVISLGIIILSIIPAGSTNIHLPINNVDKIGHFLAYLMLSIFIGLLFYKTKKYFFVLFFGFLLGLILEKIQSYIPGRSMSGCDLLANTSGLFVGYIAIIFFRDNIILEFEKLTKFLFKK